jgi:hypothetical protein
MDIGSLEEPGSLLQLGQQQDTNAHQHLDVPLTRLERLERPSCGEWMLTAFMSHGVFSSLASSRIQMLTSINKMFLGQEWKD